MERSPTRAAREGAHRKFPLQSATAGRLTEAKDKDVEDLRGDPTARTKKASCGTSRCSPVQKVAPLFRLLAELTEESAKETDLGLQGPSAATSPRTVARH